MDLSSKSLFNNIPACDCLPLQNCHKNQQGDATRDVRREIVSKTLAARAFSCKHFKIWVGKRVLNKKNRKSFLKKYKNWKIIKILTFVNAKFSAELLLWCDDVILVVISYWFWKFSVSYYKLFKQQKQYNEYFFLYFRVCCSYNFKIKFQYI